MGTRDVTAATVAIDDNRLGALAAPLVFDRLKLMCSTFSGLYSVGQQEIGAALIEIMNSVLARVNETKPVEDKHSFQQVGSHACVCTIRCRVLYRCIVHAQVIQAPTPQIWSHIDLEAVQGNVALSVLILDGLVVTCSIGCNEQSRI